MIPIVFYARWLQDFGQDEDRISNIEWVVIALEFALAVLMLFVGTYFALNNIINSWRTYGYPFTCHCENLWNTCACSGSHAGMRHCTGDTARMVIHSHVTARTCGIRVRVLVRMQE